MNGQCLCGSVAFEFRGPTSNIEICHCTRCQRSTGSAFAADFRVRPENFRWLRGEDLIAVFDAPVLRKPPAYRRFFCKTCGSVLPAVFPDEAIVMISAGLVEGPIAARAIDHIWISKKASWLDLTTIGSLPVHDEEATDAAHHKALMAPLDPE